MILAVDAGNSRVKWALHDGRGFVHEGRVPLGELAGLPPAWTNLPEPAAIAVANVAGDAVAKSLRDAFSRWKVPSTWVAGQREQCGVRNLYADPAQLGPDRWSALIGARHRWQGDCVVVNSGTAMTVDALSAAGEFLGGLIVPGFDLMHRSLADHTARLSADRGNFVRFPRTSADAITTGAVQALAGAVERMAQAMQDAGHGVPRLIVTGGAAMFLDGHLRGTVDRADHLVLEGLVRIARTGMGVA